MAFLTWLALTLAGCALAFCAYLYLELQKYVLRSALPLLLQQSSEELSKNYGKQFRGIETEWDDMYQKFSRLAGRMDREKRSTPQPEPEEPTPPTALTRSELLRRWRSKS